MLSKTLIMALHRIKEGSIGFIQRIQELKVCKGTLHFLHLFVFMENYTVELFWKLR